MEWVRESWSPVRPLCQSQYYWDHRHRPIGIQDSRVIQCDMLKNSAPWPEVVGPDAGQRWDFHFRFKCKAYKYGSIGFQSDFDLSSWKTVLCFFTLEKILKGLKNVADMQNFALFNIIFMDAYFVHEYRIQSWAQKFGPSLIEIQWGKGLNFWRINSVYDDVIWSITKFLVCHLKCMPNQKSVNVKKRLKSSSKILIHGNQWVKSI